MRQDHQVEAMRIEGQGLEIERLERSRSLKQPAVDQHPMPRTTQFHAGAGNRASGAMKNEFDRHGRISPLDASNRCSRLIPLYIRIVP